LFFSHLDRAHFDLTGQTRAGHLRANAFAAFQRSAGTIESRNGFRSQILIFNWSVCQGICERFHHDLKEVANGCDLLVWLNIQQEVRLLTLLHDIFFHVPAPATIADSLPLVRVPAIETPLSKGFTLPLCRG
jgi:hypothetical protein